MIAIVRRFPDYSTTRVVRPIKSGSRGDPISNPNRTTPCEVDGGDDELDGGDYGTRPTDVAADVRPVNG